MDLQATVRRATKTGAGAQRDLRETGYESLVVAEFEPANYELSRAGRRFALGYSSAVTGKQSVTALATTAAHWTIFNNETAGVGKSYVFEQIGVYNTSGTPGVGGILWGSFFTAPASSGASDSGISFQSLSNGSLGTKCIVKSTVTITQPTAPTWFPLADNPSPNVNAFPGSGNFRNQEFRGSIILPPQTGLALYVLAPTGSTPLFAPWAIWSEIESDLE